MPLPIPDYQPIPFPAPLWLLQVLLVVGLFLHILPMNIALGGGLVSSFCLVLGKRPNGEYWQRLGKALAHSLPLATSFAITQGIVPLLFLQLLYGPLYYSASILMAVPWLALVPMLGAGYYGFYLYTYSKRPIQERSPWPLIATSLIFLAIAFMFTNTMTLMLTPDKWAAMYQGNAYGLNLNLNDAQLIPRYLHFVVAAFAVTGLLVGCFGLYWLRREKSYGEWLLQKGALLFLIPTVLQLGIGTWFLLSLPREVMHNFMGQDTLGTVLFGISTILTLISIAGMTIAWARQKAWAFKMGMHSAICVIFIMVVMRHLLRVYFTAPFLEPESVAVQPQWDLLTVFLLAAVGLIVYLVWLTRTVWKAYNPAMPAEEKVLVKS